MLTKQESATRMALADPQTVTVNAVAQVMPRVSAGANSSTYRTNDQTHELVPSHTYGNRQRHSIRFNFKKIAADPLTSDNAQFSGSTYLVIDVPVVGYTVAEAKNEVVGFLAYLQASSAAAITALLGGEN